MKIIILGSTGMLGSYVSSYLKRTHDNVVIVTPSKEEFNVTKEISKGDMVSSLNILAGDVVVNCAGIINKRDDILDPAKFLRESISVNAVFPHIMAMRCHNIGARFIHITTDCVFDGTKGRYRESDEHTAVDIYGITKSCGEPSPEMCILIRSSIIGESKNGRSLIEWLRLSNGTTVTGYTNHIWNGVTCLELARCIHLILNSGSKSGLFTITSPEPVTKYELCKKIADAYEWPVDVRPGKGPQDVDRTLVGTMVSDKTIDDQIKEMVSYYR